MIFQEIPSPVAAQHDVLLCVNAVGVCGTDLHSFGGSSNYNKDTSGVAIPLTAQSHILGHEFCGTIQEIGQGVTAHFVEQCVIVQQILTCVCQGHLPVFEFCESGDSHQCERRVECGITGIPGAFADYVAVPDAIAFATC
jgi:threonine dehydrogenase-like Zn-dependent dehydrogenase